MKKIILLLTLVLSTFCYAKDFRKVKIIMENGTEKNGLIGFPIKNNSIKFKTESGEEEKIKSDDIKRLIIKTKKSTYVIDRTQYNKLKKKKTKVSKRKAWYIITEYCNKLTLYSSGHKFKLNKDDSIYAEIKGEKGLISFWYLFKRPNELYPSLIEVDYGKNSTLIGIGIRSQFRKLAKRYFKGFPKLIKRIDNKEFKGSAWNLHKAFCELN